MVGVKNKRQVLLIHSEDYIGSIGMLSLIIITIWYKIYLKLRQHQYKTPLMTGSSSLTTTMHYFKVDTQRKLTKKVSYFFSSKHMSQSDKHAISIFVVRRIVSLDNHSVTGNLYKKCVPSYGQRMLTMWFYNYHSRYRQVLFEELV